MIRHSLKTPLPGRVDLITWKDLVVIVSTSATPHKRRGRLGGESGESTSVTMPTVAELACFLRRLGANIQGLGLIALGLLCMVDPVFASKMYGLPTVHDEWVIVAGIRDAGLGLATLALHYFAPASIRIFAPAIMPIPVGDAAAVFFLGGEPSEAAIHLLGTVAIGVLSVCAWLDPSLDAPLPKKQA